MALRYRRSKKILPGVRLNINKNSVGLTLGGKGLKYTINSKGKKTATVGIPGTGLSYSKNLSTKQKNERPVETVSPAASFVPIRELAKRSTLPMSFMVAAFAIVALAVCFSPKFLNMLVFTMAASFSYLYLVARDRIKAARKALNEIPELNEGDSETYDVQNTLLILYRGTKWRVAHFVISAVLFLVFVCVGADMNSTGTPGSGWCIAMGAVVLFYGAVSLKARLDTAKANKLLNDRLEADEGDGEDEAE